MNLMTRTLIFVSLAAALTTSMVGCKSAQKTDGSARETVKTVVEEKPMQKNADDAKEATVRDIWQAGDLVVTAIQDRPGQMSMSIFSGPASDEERAKYFTDGSTEAGTNVFLLRTGDYVTLFDTGVGAKLIEALDSLGIKTEDVNTVLITHMHGDHIGGLLHDDTRTFSNAKVFVSKPELESWLALAEKDSANAGAAKVKSVVAAYGDDLQTFAFGDSPIEAVTAIDAVGHTPGHTVYQLTADNKSLLIVGDLIHAASLQFALPDECASFDMDRPQAIQARKRIFDLAAHNDLPIAGMHFPFGKVIGKVTKDSEGWKFE